MSEAEGLTTSSSLGGSYDTWTHHLRVVRGNAKQEIEELERRIDEERNEKGDVDIGERRAGGGADGRL